MSDDKKISKLDSLSDAISEFAKKKRENAEPSQPAGAREWLPKQPIINYLLEMYKGRFATDIVAAMEAYARQQTAAKDAEISEARRLISEYIDTINSFDALGSVAARDRLRAFMKGKPARNQRAEAAERERDSLLLLLEQSQKENALLYEELTQLKARVKELMNHLLSSGT